MSGHSADDTSFKVVIGATTFSPYSKAKRARRVARRTRVLYYVVHGKVGRARVMSVAEGGRGAIGAEPRGGIRGSITQIMAFEETVRTHHLRAAPRPMPRAVTRQYPRRAATIAVSLRLSTPWCAATAPRPLGTLLAMCRAATICVSCAGRARCALTTVRVRTGSCTSAVMWSSAG